MPEATIHRSGSLALTRRLLGVLVAVLALGLTLPPAPASAHAELLSTVPSAGAVLAGVPNEVELTFDEPVFLVRDGFQLYDGSGAHRTVPVAAVDATVHVTLPVDLAEGSYVLGWRVVCDDSHPESGVLSFAVGRADATAPTVSQADPRPVGVLYGTLTALGYLGLSTLVGPTVFDLVVARSASGGRRLPLTAGLLAVSAQAALVPLAVVRERGSGLNGLLEPAAWTDGWAGAAAATLALSASGVALLLLRRRRSGRVGLVAAAAGGVVALASVLPLGTPGPSDLGGSR